MLKPLSRFSSLLVLAVSLTACAQAPAARNVAPNAAVGNTPSLLLRDGDTLAIIGDSITEQKKYSVFMEAYLAACTPLDVRVAQCGWSGDSCWWFLGRHSQDAVAAFHPTVATTCFGMNDGGYKPASQKITSSYHDGLVQVVENLQKAGIERMVVGSPGAVDTTSFKNKNATPTQYNQNLGTLAKQAQLVAGQFDQRYVDVQDEMLMVMKLAKARYGQDYLLAGGDGVHPGDNGHLVMAYTFLKGLGLDGDIGTITLDASAGTATASAGHTVDAATPTSVTLTSTRYPFCFYGNPESANATTGVIQFFPFNQDLNRFTLVVKDLNAPRAKVTFGESSKEFTADQLAAGINLAAEFIDNPFSEPFKNVLKAVRDKQNAETHMYKALFPSFADLLKDAQEDSPDSVEAVKKVEALTLKRDAKLAADVKQAVEPVKYTITVEPVQ